MQSELLDVVIGVVFVWFLYSLVLSALSEAVAWASHARAKHLWLGIGRLLDPQVARLPRTFLDTVIRLPFGTRFDIRPRVSVPPGEAWRSPVDVARESLFKARLEAEADRRAPLAPVYRALAVQVPEVAKEGRVSKLTAVRAGAFADAVLALATPVLPRDLVPTAQALGWDQAQLEALRRKLPPDPEQALRREEVVAWAADGLPGDDLAELHLAAGRRLRAQDVVELCGKNPALAAAVRQAARAAANAATDEVEAVRATLETWFDREMDRISAIYRRQSRKLLAVFALVLVLVTHANAVALFRDLRHDTNLREASTSAALSAAAARDIERAIDAGECPDAPDELGDEDPFAGAGRKLDCTAKLLDLLEDHRVGLAWDDLRAAHERSTPTEADDESPTLALNDVGSYATDVLPASHGVVGRGITLVALLFGAQFWYDSLRRLVGIRKFLTGRGGSAAG